LKWRSLSCRGTMTDEWFPKMTFAMISAPVHVVSRTTQTRLYFERMKNASRSSLIFSFSSIR
jgi:hypothetical protein